MAFQDMLQQKYQIQSRTAQSEAELRRAQAGRIATETALAPANAAATRAQAYGTAAGEIGRGIYSTALGGAATARIPSEIELAGAQAEQARAEAARTQFSLTPGSGNIGGTDMGTNYAKGTDKVPGRAPKTGNTDTQKAMLTPGEAVLNVGAAEHLGRDVIDVLNAIGNIKMMGDKGAQQTSGPATQADIHGAGGIPGYSDGMSDVPNGTDRLPAYATGTSNIDPKSSGIEAMPGQGGSWGPTGDAQPAPGSNTGIRAAVGMQGKPRPSVMGGTTPGGLPGYAEGTSEVMARTHSDAARNSKAGKGDTQGYAKGTAKVPGKAKAVSKGASKITPEMIQAIMNMGKGGGGLIPPGQGAPMPMAMPQVAPQGGMGP